MTNTPDSFNPPVNGPITFSKDFIEKDRKADQASIDRIAAADSAKNNYEKQAATIAFQQNTSRFNR